MIPPLTDQQYQAAMSITSCFETDDPIGDYSNISILQDGAGISYGKHQATENGGELYQVLQEYISLKGTYAMQFAPYMAKLYDGEDSARKGQLTENTAFKQLLVKAANDDQAMREAQDVVFNRDYFQPAIALCGEWDLSLPLGVAMSYEQAIQYGPKTQRALWHSWRDHIDKTKTPDDLTIPTNTPPELQQEMRIIYQLNERMRAHRAASHKAAVRKTVYRNDTFTDLIDAQNWQLVPPFGVRVAYRTITVTAAILAQIPPPPKHLA